MGKLISSAYLCTHHLKNYTKEKKHGRINNKYYTIATKPGFNFLPVLLYFSTCHLVLHFSYNQIFREIILNYATLSHQNTNS